MQRSGSNAPLEHPPAAGGWALRGALGLAAAVVVSLASCLGDVVLEVPPEPPAVTPDGGETTDVVALVPACEVGLVRCNEGWVERCLPGDTAPDARWTKFEDCQSEALCEQPGQCRPPACRARAVRCEGATPERCKADLTGWEALDPCASAAHCSLDLERCSASGSAEAPCCLDVPCQPGELRCNANELERCRDDQTELDRVADCVTPGLCDESLADCEASPEACACVPPACEAGETRCDGSTLLRCNPDQTAYEFVETCASAELCALGRARTPLACEPPACPAGSFSCDGEGVLRACNAAQTGFEPGVPCDGGAAFCNAGQGICTTTPCAPGDRACDGAQVLGCREDRTGFAPLELSCATAELCLDDGQGEVSCLTPACPADEVRCSGSQLQRCNPGRTAFANLGPACPRADLCSAQRQRCDFCVPSRQECTPDLRSARQCAADGNSFGPSTFCPLGCVAQSGTCNTCQVGSYSCNGGLISRCNDGFSFTPLNRGSDCSGGTLVSCNGNAVQNAPCGAPGCNTTRNACNECSGVTRVCAGAASFRACQPDGTFGPTASCADGLTCTGAGQCACTPNAASCAGDALLACNATGDATTAGVRCSGPGGNVLRSCDDGALTANTCASGALCEAAAGATCPACLDGESSCSAASGQPLDCLDGALVARGPCGAGLSCEGAGLCLCAAGELRCDGDELTSCNVGRTAFEPAAACGGPLGATLRTCDDGLRTDTECLDADACAAAEDGQCTAAGPG